MSPRLIFLTPDFQIPIHDSQLPNLEYRILPANLPISQSTESLIRSCHKLNIFYSKLFGGGIEPELNRILIFSTLSTINYYHPVGGFKFESFFVRFPSPKYVPVLAFGTYLGDRTSGRSGGGRQGSILRRFPHEPSPFLSSVPNIQTPIPEYRISNIGYRFPNTEYRIPNIVPQFPNLLNLLREDSNLIRIRRAFL
jgi:hypothetical protein